MNQRTNYKMTQEDLDTLMKSMKSVPYMVMGGREPSSPQENANRAWAALGEKMGFDSTTVMPRRSAGDRYFSAVANETEDHKEARIDREQNEFNDKEIVRLEKEIEDKKIAVFELRDHVLLSMDGNQWCATEKDFINLQESDAGFGDTMEDAIEDLRRLER